MAWGQSAVNESNPRPQRVLIVEDDPRLLLAISDVLSDEGYETREALSFAAVQMRSIWLPVLATFSIHTTPCVSGHPSVVVMQAIEDWECHDTTLSLGHSRQRLFLPEALV